MKQTRKLTVFSSVIVISILFMLVFPLTVLADDSTPPPAETPEVLPPTEVPVTTDTPEIPSIELTPTGEAVTPAAPTSEEPVEVDVAEIIQTAVENDITLAEPSGDPLEFASVAASEALANGDPYFISGNVTYRFYSIGGCAVWGGVSATCTESATPIQAALTFAETHHPDLLVAPDGTLRRTIFVEPGTYNEQLTINAVNANLTLWGNPGSLTVPGAGASAPVLDGSTWASGDTGVTINAEGVALIGFIIQNYETAVSQPIVVGNNVVTISQNTIQNNGKGIVVLSDQGSPGSNVTYNIFQNNSSFDLVNGAPDDNNVQYVNAPNNYWGCATGPVVAYRIFTGTGKNKVWTGQWGYINWATQYDYGVNGSGLDPDPACAVLYGSDSLFDHQLGTPGYSPYKINIGSFFTQIDTPGLSLDKTASPGTYSAVGQVISYSYVVTNTGNVTLSGPFTVADNKTSVTCPAGGLAPGASKTCTASYTITQADLDSGSVTNTARASANGTDSNQDSATVTAVQSPALSINKSASPTTYSAVGQVINYSYIVTNTGNVTISGPFVVSDDKSTDENCPITLSLAPGASITCTASYTITQADLNAGSVTNIASATNGNVTSPSDTETVRSTLTPALSVLKSETSTGPYVVGSTITYNIVVTNTGLITLTGVSVSDPSATVGTCTPAQPSSLTPGASMTCAASHVVTQSDINNGSYSNTATGDSDQTLPSTSTVTVNFVATPALSVVKSETSTGPYVVGSTITYNIVVTNTGNVTLTGVSVSDNSAVLGTCTPAQPSSLTPGASMTCAASHVVTQSDINNGSYSNTATGDSDQTLPSTSTVTVNFVATPALSVVKSETSTGPYVVGSTITYNIVVTNTGNVTLTGVSVSDPSATVGTCTPAQPSSLTPGASMTCAASHVVTQSDINNGSYSNTATGDSDQTLPSTSTVTVNFVATPALSVVKSETSTGPYVVGSTITYNIVVTNTGNVTLTGVSVSDPSATVGTCTPAQPSSLTPGASMTCAASHVVTQSDINNGSYSNTATGDSDQTLPSTSTVTVNFVATPALSVVKSETSTGPYVVGSTITYNIVVTNTGNVTLTGVSVSDPSATVGTCTPAQPSSLTPGASMTCAASHVVTQTDINNGSYSNTATGSSNQTPPSTSTVTVNFTRPRTPPNTPTPPTDPNPVRPSVSFTGFIPVTGGETHAIAAGTAHTCAITPEGDVQCWGNNNFGQLGDGTKTGSNVPVDVVGIGGGTTIVAGGNHTCVLTAGEVWCWGQNSHGQLGDGTQTDRNVPVRVLSNAVDLTAGLDYTCAIMLYGQVMCWGNNDQGQLADGTRIDRTTPTLASLISSISNVDAGRNRSCGLTEAGLLSCLTEGNAQDLGGMIPVTGQAAEINLDVAVNRFGSLIMALVGNGVPVKYQAGKFEAITDVTRAIDVDSGLGHVCALVADGTVSCWGSNFYGQLGRNTKVSSQAPKSVLNVSGAWQLAVGRNHVCVLITSSTPGTNDIQCWGLNTDGQLGDGTYSNSAIPVFVK